MAVKIFTDSASDITQEKARELGITVIPMSTMFGTKEYLDGVTLSRQEFYSKLSTTDKLPHTSQITPFQYAEVFRNNLPAGDEALCITLSSKLSGSFAAALSAAEEFEGRVRIVDSLNVSVGEQILVLLAVRLRDQGLNAEEIQQELDKEKEKIRLLALLDTLEYLKKGGRISPTLAFAGELLSIKPVVAVEKGEVVLVGKARGSKNGNNLLRKFVEKNGINFDLPCCLAYSGLSDDLLQKYLRDSQSLYEGHEEDLHTCLIGSTIGTHVGPGAVAVAFFCRK